MLRDWERDLTENGGALTYSANITPAVAGLQDFVLFTCALTGNAEIEMPTGGRLGQRVILILLASGADRTITLDSVILTPALAGSGAGVTPSGKKRYLELVCVGTDEWFLAADRIDA
jgi:hypothetical protein